MIGKKGVINPFQYNGSKKIIAKNGAVASAHPLASKVGMEIMRQGGNAFDAAIATQLTLAVVYPGAGNIGGGGFMIFFVEPDKSWDAVATRRAPCRPEIDDHDLPLGI